MLIPNSGYCQFANKKKRKREEEKKKKLDNTAIDISVLASLIQSNNTECKMFTLNKKLFALARFLTLCLKHSQVNILNVCIPKR